MTKNLKPLERAALKAMEHSYSPYSRIRVGSACQVEDGQIFSGTNVENASYGATVCAERVALWNAVSAGFAKITAIAIATEASPPWAPCGLCRQVLSEFSDASLEIRLINPKGESVVTSLGQLFPAEFGPKQLRSATSKLDKR